MSEAIDFVKLRQKKKEAKQEIAKSYEFDQGINRRIKYVEAFEKNKIDEKTILYQSYFGRGMICHPYALFKEFMKDERFKDFKHVWVFDEIDQHEIEMDLYKDCPNVIFVDMGDDEYLDYLTTAKYLVNNVTFPYYFIKKEGQVLINTWHGIPLKNLGFDMPEGNVDTTNTLRNFFQTDYLISANNFTTENFKSAFKLDGVYNGKIIETGYPRNDIFFDYDKEQLIEKFKKFGVDIDPNKKVVIYAPTWKGKEYGDPNLDVDEYDRFLDTMYKYVDKDKYQILFKPHQVVYKHLRDKGKLKSYYIPATIDTNELMSITDVLISDYSSIFFDYMATGRPVLFYIPDLETYQEERGLYFPPEDLPGPITKDLTELGMLLKDIDNYKDSFDYSKYTKTKEWATGNDDGNVCKRVIDVVLGEEKDTLVHSNFDNGKIKVLIHNDTMKTNGITSSMMNLLKNIDYDKYDVTVCANRARFIDREEGEDNTNKINKHARVLYRNTFHGGTKKEFIDNELTLYYGVDIAKKKKFFPAKMYEREFDRCFYGVDFDYVINFSGYSMFLSLVFASKEKPKKLIWMHNDMKAERERFEDGERKFYALGTTYPLYDKLVSCSKSVMEINKENLGTPEIMDKFGYARNLVSDERIQECLKENRWVTIDDKPYYVKTIEEKQGENYSIELINGMEEGTVSFVTMGRLSYEKNHLEMIEAFGELYKEYPNARLHILGEGPLQKDEENLIKKLQLENKVILTGNLSNPFAYIKRCDCYIMPSIHEGQPMAILEARMMDMPIIVSDFSTVKDSLYENGQLLIKKDKQSIYEGMKAFMEGQVPNEFKFDIDEYNKIAIKEFLANF